jgi:hypothetical protein
MPFVLAEDPLVGALSTLSRPYRRPGTLLGSGDFQLPISVRDGQPTHTR